MKILLRYLKPHKWLVTLVLTLAAINIGFSLVDPIILGRLINLANYFTNTRSANPLSWHDFLLIKTTVVEKIPKINKQGVVEITERTMILNGVLWLLLASITVAMISRIAKNFQDYFMNVVVQKFGAKVFTDGLQHAMKLPYQEFEDQRSGETLGILQKVRTDTEKFLNYFINVLFGVIVGVVFVFVYAAIWIHWSIPIVYLVGISLLTFISNVLSKKIKVVRPEF
jgi:ATP-binding cassette subfamily B protein